MNKLTVLAVVALLIVCSFGFFSNIRISNAAETVSVTAKINKKLDEVISNQAIILEKLEDIQKEVYKVKVRGR
ncbi:hypothetical protein ACFL0T_03955 [Candidatus Omnitrophota bacterium]